MKRQWLDGVINPVLAVASLGFCLLVLEIACRIFPLVGDRELRINDPYYYVETIGQVRHHVPFYTYRERIPTRFDTRGYYAPSGGVVSFHSNQFGARWIKPTDQDVADSSVFVVGDSFTYGHALHYEDAFIYRVQEHLGQQGRRVSFLNFAERGADSRQVLATYLRFQSSVRHNVVLYGLHVNDLVNFSTSSAITNLLAVPWLVQRSKGFYFLTEGIEKHWFREYKIGRMTSPSRFTKGFFTENLDAILKLRDATEQHHARFIVVVLPILLDIEKGTFNPLYRGIAARLAEHGIDYVDLTGNLKGHREEDLWVLPFDQHPNNTANEIFAEGLLDEFETGHLLPVGS